MSAIVHTCGGRSYVPLELFLEILGAQRGSEVLAAAEMPPTSRSPCHDGLIEMMIEEVLSHLPAQEPFRPRDIYGWLEQRPGFEGPPPLGQIERSLWKESKRGSPRIARVGYGRYAVAREH
jgi:hypothetical protein